MSLVCLSLVACGGVTPGAEYDETRSPIINGEACDEQTNPDVVAILPQMTVSAGGQTFTVNTIACTGTLIAPDVVLAAGHCVDKSVYAAELQQQGLTLKSIAFFISYKADLTSMTTNARAQMPDDAVRVGLFKIHPDYSLQSFTTGPQKTNDISVLFLEAPQEVQPAIVITSAEGEQLEVGTSLDIVGWGQRTASTNPSPSDVGSKYCGVSFINELERWELQVGSGTSSTRKCHGDSGGPSFATVEASSTIKRRIVGITSHAYDQQDCRKGGVDTRVDAYVGWLEQTLTTGCDNGDRIWCDVKGVIPPEYYDPPASAGSGGDASGGGGNTAPAGRGCATTGMTPAMSLFLISLFVRRSRRSSSIARHSPSF